MQETFHISGFFIQSKKDVLRSLGKLLSIYIIVSLNRDGFIFAIPIDVFCNFPETCS